MLKRILFAATFFIVLTTTCYGKQIAWHDWVQQVRTQAIHEGIKPALFDQLFSNLTPNQKILGFDRSQPEHRITYYKYRNSRGSKYRILIGRKEFKRYHTLLIQIGKEFQVNPCIIVAIWGLESAYGRFKGNFDVIRSLATLAYDGRRSSFFRKELLQALHMLNQDAVLRKDFIGEWAGASGHSQFLPSSWFKYAYDYDLNGTKDIWNSLPDAFASIANYLHKNGWILNQPILAEVTLPSNFNHDLLGLEHKKTISKWHKLGIYTAQNLHLPTNSEASIIHPDGGPYLMVFNNFRTLLAWNYSSYYVGTVDYVSKGICKK